MAVMGVMGVMNSEAGGGTLESVKIGGCGQALFVSFMSAGGRHQRARALNACPIPIPTGPHRRAAADGIAAAVAMGAARTGSSTILRTSASSSASSFSSCEPHPAVRQPTSWNHGRSSVSSA
eukprot:366412-Chlamydomonas_euryale.AAC.25